MSSALAGGRAAARNLSDWGRLESSLVYSVERPGSVDELSAVLADATGVGRSVALRGAAHSTGGQSYAAGATVIDLRRLDRVPALDRERCEIRVQAGADWAAVTRAAEPLRLGPTTKQEFECFTIGGSIAANAHGKSIDHGPLISGVRSLRVMGADGEVSEVSRDRDPELFRGVVGGYGLLGIIVDATLGLVPDPAVRNAKPVMMDVEELIESYVGALSHDRSRMPLCYGFMDPACKRGFYLAYSIDDEASARGLDELRGHEPPVALFNAFVGVQRRSARARAAAIRATFAASRRPELTLRSRRLLLWEQPPRGLAGSVLQKYVVPVERFASFVRAAREVLESHRRRLPVMTPHFRFVPGDDEAMLPLSPSDGICFILSHLARPGDEDWRRSFADASSALVDAALAEGGRHYLTFDRTASRAQLLRGYPAWDRFVSLKRARDPGRLFTSSFFEAYER